MELDLDKERFSLFYARVKDSFEILYRFAFFAVLIFFSLNLILQLMFITFIFVILSINHIIVPLARTAGIF